MAITSKNVQKNGRESKEMHTSQKIILNCICLHDASFYTETNKPVVKKVKYLHFGKNFKYKGCDMLLIKLWAFGFVEDSKESNRNTSRNKLTRGKKIPLINAFFKNTEN